MKCGHFMVKIAHMFSVCLCSYRKGCKLKKIKIGYKLGPLWWRRTQCCIEPFPWRGDCDWADYFEAYIHHLLCFLIQLLPIFLFCLLIFGNLCFVRWSLGRKWFGEGPNRNTWWFKRWLFWNFEIFCSLDVLEHFLYFPWLLLVEFFFLLPFYVIYCNILVLCADQVVSESSIPLSPQWLYAKPVDAKTFSGTSGVWHFQILICVFK